MTIPQAAMRCNVCQARPSWTTVHWCAARRIRILSRQVDGYRIPRTQISRAIVFKQSFWSTSIQCQSQQLERIRNLHVKVRAETLVTTEHQIACK